MTASAPNAATAPAVLSVAEVHSEVMALMGGAPEGPELDEVTAALVRIAVHAAPTTLDVAGTAREVGRALELGVEPQQLQEMLVLISGMGMHALIGTAEVLAREVRGHRGSVLEAPLAGDAATLARELLGAGGREARVAAVAPEFWPNLLRLSPVTTVRAIADFRAAPWSSATLTMLQRELIGIAVDAMASHRFLPTLRLHVLRALELGAGTSSIRAVLAIAAAAPEHPGVR